VKRIVLGASLAACLFAAQNAKASDDLTSKCKSISTLAGTIMKARQAGTSMSEMMEVKIGPDVKDLATSMIVSAFETPRFNTEKIKQETISDFRDDWYLKCVKASTR